jgi:hypothetical protein
MTAARTTRIYGDGNQAMDSECASEKMPPRQVKAA